MLYICTCKHVDQDALHGTNVRVYNQGNLGSKCTVCGTKIAAGALKAEKAKK